MPRQNNFDLIRLAAALQVAITHALPHFIPEARDSYVLEFIELFPGVPIFFFVSGFLISRSFEQNSNLGEYAINRVLRIYPGLAACFAVSLLTIALTGYFGVVRPAASQFVPWILAQLTCLQFYNPDFMRGYGVGVLNGSMWTIVVELQFYVLVPVLYGLLRVNERSRRRSNGVLAALIGVFWVANVLYVRGESHHASELIFKLLGVSFLPWFYMFLVGVLFQWNCQRLLSRLRGSWAIALVLAYCVLAVLGNRLLGLNLGNTLSLPLFLALATCVFAAAFLQPGLSDRLLRRNDISYGVYIYHMPMVNLALALGLGGSTWGFLGALCATLACAVGSWTLIEKPALRWKRHPLYKHDAATPSSADSAHS